MKFTNVRLIGFKSFVEPTDFEIREGLTGIVGPNGCGKSNLLEALRWVMGATSAKALRGDGMDAVIFAGTTMRPARNWAEVILSLDNSDRTAPAEWNEHDALEVSRRIIRKEEGTQSIYRINGKEVRAKDVQLLFADASTGANSPALVRQGQISELINAKPQNRRRLLEEAAGVTGLHSRRHEAELRLRAAEQNLERLDDVIGELETQKTGLARQARQATRYRNVSGDIRRTEAMLNHLRWSEAKQAQETASAGLEEMNDLILDTSRAAVLANKAQTSAHEVLEPLRQQEAETAAALHRLTVAREGLDEEARRAEAELNRLNGEINRFAADLERESGLLRDAESAFEKQNAEAVELRAQEDGEQARVAEAEAAMKEAAEKLAEIEREFEAKNKEAAEISARRRSVEGNIANAERRLNKIIEQTQSYTHELELVTPSASQAETLEEAKSQFTQAEEAATQAEAAFQRAEEERQGAEQREVALRGPLRQAEQGLTEIGAERDALLKILAASESEDFRPLLEDIDVDPGYENALAAALGDDLGAATDEAAPAHWSAGDGASAEALPGGAQPLSNFVRGPAAVQRRLAAIGVVDAGQLEALKPSLRPGQRLVSREGDLVRWDGFVSRADAKTAAAVRLEQRNRVAALEVEIEDGKARVTAAKTEYDSALADVQTKKQIERDARNLSTEARRNVDKARSGLSGLERENERAQARISSIKDSLARLSEDKTESEQTLSSLREDQSNLPNSELLDAAVAELRTSVEQARALAAETRGAHAGLAREAQARKQRLGELERESGSWRQRADTAKTRINEMETRLADTKTAREAAAGAPAAIEEKRNALLDQLGEAETKRNEAADALASAVSASQNADQTCKEADAAAAEAREGRARLQAQAEAAAERLEEAISLARETCEAAPEQLLAISEHKADKELPERGDVERKLERYKRERENLGGVNLRADEELKEVTERIETLGVEREDCDSAIRKLRAAIGGLNREARQRLLEAFETVNSNFSTLFKRLFNGGQAELRLIDSDDPLDAGLEIMASPPGKKLTSMSLMSGGEQALTATSLIFAVFMANPAPVCVLDEVDAPLDDANVERFCRMLHDMAAETQTRFIIITHHALTMSRMSRLFGVTMIERGVSQLVSVDLSKAEQLAAAE